MSDLPRLPAEDLQLNRRLLLKYGAAGLVTAALSPLLQACSENTPLGPKLKSARPSGLAMRAARLQDMLFEDELVEVPFGDIV